MRSAPAETAATAVQVASDPLNSWGYALGHSLWTAAPELIDFLGQVLPPGSLHGRRVIELGAGLGTVGIVSPAI